MVRRYLIVLTILATAATSALAGITGILTGKVLDKAKKPVSGASIVVLGTTRGGIAKADGSYQIVNINAGTHKIRVTALGYDTVFREVTINADETRRLDFTLAEGGGATSDTIQVVSDKIMIRQTDLGSQRTMTGSDMQKIARDNVASALSLQAGIRADGNNFVVRGSRTTETQVLVDGLAVTDQFSGGLGNVGSTISMTMPSPFMIQSVAAQTGGFGAEYGNAVGGVVNSVVKQGSTERYDGIFRWRRDVPFMYGYAGNGYRAGNPGQDMVDATLSGPLGFNNSTFSIGVRNLYENHRNAGLDVPDPVGNSTGFLPNNRTWGRNLTGRMRFQFNQDMYLNVGGMFGMTAGELSSWGQLYADEQGMVVDNFGNPILDGNGNVQYNGVPSRNAQQVVVQEFSSNAFAQLNHTIDNATTYDVRFSYNAKTTEIGKRKNTNQPGIFSGWDVFTPEDNLAFADSVYVPGSNRILDEYDYLRVPAYTEDGYARIEVTKRNPITGYIEGPSDAQSTSNPYGLINYFTERGNSGGVDFRTSRFWQADGNIQTLLKVGETEHVIKGGVELRLFRLTRHYNANPWDGTPFYDVYGSDYGGNLYFDLQDSSTAAVNAKLASEEPYNPVTAAVFVQDQIIFKSLVFTPGLRVDYLNANATYRTSFDRFIPFGDSVGFSPTTAKLYLSPRISVGFPINDNKSQDIKLSYGIYYQAAPFAEMFDAFNVFQLRGSQLLGNPNMEMQRTNQYEIAYRNQMTDDFALTITGYYKDVYNQPDIAFVRVLPNPYFQKLLSAYGTVRGLEFTFQKRVVNNWGFMINYTLSQARGTANSSTTAPGIDPYTENPAFPVTDFPLAVDRPHRINVTTTLEYGTDQGPRIAGIPFLENFTITLSGVWQSGSPYTPVDARGQALGEINSARFPSVLSSELRIIRTIPLGDFLGGAKFVDLTLDVNNVLNLTDAIGFYTTTGSPDNDGISLARPQGDFPSTTYYRDANIADKSTIDPQQYDRIGRRMYNPVVDFNSDGKVTAEESYRGYQNYVRTVIDRRGNYQFPRTVFFAVAFRF